jgi:hypothetical protein
MKNNEGGVRAAPTIPCAFASVSKVSGFPTFPSATSEYNIPIKFSTINILK